MRRIDQLLSSLGYCSRSEVREWVKEGRITVGGIAAKDPAMRVDPSHVLVDGEPPDHPGELLIMLNKPAGRVCSHDSSEGPSVYGLLPERWRRRNPPMVSVGRLDKDAAGLLLLTDVSALVHRLTSPRHKVPKVYRVLLDTDLPHGIEEVFSSGGLVLPDEDKPCAPAPLVRLGAREAEVTLTEGRYHQVKRMFGSQGCTVTELQRIRFGPLAIGSLPVGSWIELPVNSLDKI
jgi:16S rRNA pseudouridine516 synthase